MKIVKLIIFLIISTNLSAQTKLENVIGKYGGYFNANKYYPNKKPSYSNEITIEILSFKNNNIQGRSIVAGNSRPFSGTFRIEKNVIVVSAKEPGDDKYDGIFKFKIMPKERSIVGLWSAYDQNLAVTDRDYELNYFNFEYNKDLELPKNISWSDLFENNPNLRYEGDLITEDVLKINPSKNLLKKEDVENLHKGDLEVLRNSIYARHGYSFKNRRMRYIFDNKIEWYHPISIDVRNELTNIELENEDLLKRYEKHAKQYYDSYGR